MGEHSWPCVWATKQTCLTETAILSPKQPAFAEASAGKTQNYAKNCISLPWIG